MDAKRAPGPTWETVRYMVAAIQYGGRITDEFDKFLMQTYAERYFHQVRDCSLPFDNMCPESLLLLASRVFDQA